MTPQSPLCLKCKHLITALEWPGKCEAFDEIPIKFWEEGKRHDKKEPGQKNDLVYEPKKP